MSHDPVGDFIEKRNAAAAARPNPLVTPRRALTQKPVKTGNAVTDYLNEMNWRAENRPSPLKAQR